MIAGSKEIIYDEATSREIQETIRAATLRLFNEAVEDEDIKLIELYMKEHSKVITIEDLKETLRRIQGCQHAKVCKKITAQIEFRLSQARTDTHVHNHSNHRPAKRAKISTNQACEPDLLPAIQSGNQSRVKTLWQPELAPEIKEEALIAAVKSKQIEIMKWILARNELGVLSIKNALQQAVDMSEVSITTILLDYITPEQLISTVSEGNSQNDLSSIQDRVAIEGNNELSQHRPRYL